MGEMRSCYVGLLGVGYCLLGDAYIYIYKEEKKIVRGTKAKVMAKVKGGGAVGCEACSWRVKSTLGRTPIKEREVLNLRVKDVGRWDPVTATESAPPHAASPAFWNFFVKKVDLFFFKAVKM